MTKTPLTAGTVIYHSHFGKGKVLCAYEEPNVGDMVDVHWFEKNIILDHREENLRFGLTSIVQGGTSDTSPWLALLAEEK